MPKKRKHPKLPNGYGSIKRLSGQRRNPYAVYPPAQGLDIKGNPIMQPALCYTDDWYKGMAVLTAYHAGVYQPGMEQTFDGTYESYDKPTKLIESMLRNYAAITQRITGREVEQKPTFKEVYNHFYEWKFNPNAEKQLSRASKAASKSAYTYSACLYDMPFADIKRSDLQAAIDKCPKRYATLENMLHLYHQIYKFAISEQFCTVDVSAGLKINKNDDDEHGVPFTEAELRTLWKHKDDPTIELVLILCYSGHRIQEAATINVDLNQRIFTGGVKTDSGRDRIVPIHSLIMPLVTARIKRYGKLMPYVPVTFRTKMSDALERIGIERHTPHDCRHTFSTLGARYKVDPADLKRMMGHSLSDITNKIYIHRSITDLRSEIEKIRAPRRIMHLSGRHYHGKLCKL